RSSSAAARSPWRCRKKMRGRGAYTSAPGLRRRCTARRRAGRCSTPRSSRNMRPVEIRPLPLLFLAMLAAAQPAERPNGVLLVAKPGLTDPNFRETVVLVTQTPDAQTVGVILNRPTERKLSGENVFFGGPVLRETIVALFQSRERPESPAFHVLRDVYLTMQPETVERLLARRGQRFRLYAGFSGWAPLQLQAELARDGGHVGVILNRPTKRSLGSLFPEHEPSKKVMDPVYYGGPFSRGALVALVKADNTPGAGAVLLMKNVYLAFRANTIDHVIETTPN